MEEEESGQGLYNDSPSARFARNGNNECREWTNNRFENRILYLLPLHFNGL